MTRQVIETGSSFVLILGAPGRTSTPSLVRRTQTSLSLHTTPGSGGIAALYRWRISTNSNVTNSDPMSTSSGPEIVIPNLSPGTNYWIDVRAENDAGDSDYSGNLATSTLAATSTTTTNTDEIWCYETSNASSPPSGGTTTRVHTPSGCSRSSLSAHATSWVYKYTRTRTYTNNVFTSATAWGNGTLVLRPTGSAPVSTTVSANAGSNVSVRSGDDVTIGGVDTVANPSGSTTYSWVKRSGTGGSLSSSTVQKPTFTAPTVSSNRTIVYRKTTTNNGVSDTDDITITVTPPVTTTGFSVSWVSTITNTRNIQATLPTDSPTIAATYLEGSSSGSVSQVAIRSSSGNAVDGQLSIAFLGRSLISTLESTLKLKITYGGTTLTSSIGSDRSPPYVWRPANGEAWGDMARSMFANSGTATITVSA